LRRPAAHGAVGVAAQATAVVVGVVEQVARFSSLTAKLLLNWTTGRSMSLFTVTQ
jgi:hypothetical protein